MSQNDPNQGGDVRDSRIVDPAAETPTRARDASAGQLIDQWSGRCLACAGWRLRGRVHDAGVADISALIRVVLRH